MRVTRGRQIKIGAPVRTKDDRYAGEVHRVVVDLEQQAIVAIVALGRGVPARDALVPIDLIASLDADGIRLGLTHQQLDGLPDFTYRELVTPPPTWTSSIPTYDGPILIPARQRERLGPSQCQIMPETRVLAEDGEVGHVDRVEYDPRTGRLIPFWTRSDGLFSRPMRIPIEWVGDTDAQANLHLAGRRMDIEAYLGYA
ncbi:MAG: PRC-barrel domain-containing protein [Chloroflexi bacterium]|nr:PRC-barrel domain-containing protein [Chloroflexota bacterium]